MFTSSRSFIQLRILHFVPMLQFLIGLYYLYKTPSNIFLTLGLLLTSIAIMWMILQELCIRILQYHISIHYKIEKLGIATGALRLPEECSNQETQDYSVQQNEPFE